MNLSIFYDQNFNNVADEIFCKAKDIFASANRYALNTTTKMDDICSNSHFIESLRFLGFVRVTVTIGQLEWGEVEKKCKSNGNLVHLKVIEERWFAHLLNRRSDFIMDIGKATNGIFN